MNEYVCVGIYIYAYIYICITSIENLKVIKNELLLYYCL